MDFTRLLVKILIFLRKIAVFEAFGHLFYNFDQSNFHLSIHMGFNNLLEHKQILKIQKTWDFIEISRKLQFQALKLAKKAPQDPIETPWDHKHFFYELPGYESPIIKKRNFEYLPQEKVGVTIPGVFLCKTTYLTTHTGIYSRIFSIQYHRKQFHSDWANVLWV